MSEKIKMQKILPLIIPFSIAGFSILIGFYTFFSEENIIFKILTVFLIIPGVIILLYSFREVRIRWEGRVIIKHDERSELNRLKASDRVFRFFFIALMLIFVLNSVEVINDTVFVAIIGPLAAIGITLYYFSFYWFEHKG